MPDAFESGTITGNVRAVCEHIRRAAQRAGRSPDRVRLVAATKSVPVDRILQAVQAGIGILGENRLQEALPKMMAVGSREGVSWHFIGQLQRRKVKAVVGTFELIHSVASLELARVIDRCAGEAGIRQAVLLEVNLAGEASKAGFAPFEVTDAVTALDRLSNLDVRGLMAVPPPTREAEEARPYFRRLRELVCSLAGLGLCRVRLEELSMGMSHDYEVAVEEGATLVRVGQAIFGARHG